MECKVSFHPILWIILGLLLLVVPIKAVTAVLLAAFVHESGHIICSLLLEGRLVSISLGLKSAQISVFLEKPWHRILASLSGPLFSSLLIFTYGRTPLLAACGLIQCVFNLLPIYPLDGGRIWQELKELFHTSSEKNACIASRKRVQ